MISLLIVLINLLKDWWEAYAVSTTLRVRIIPIMGRFLTRIGRSRVVEGMNLFVSRSLQNA